MLEATKRDIAYQRIKEMILRGEITSDSAFSEKKLAEALGMSRTPVREGLQKLIHEGFMRGFSGKGAMVSGISIAEAVEIVEFRMALEEFLISNIKRPLDDEQYSRLTRLIALQRPILEKVDSDAFLESDLQFHDELASIYGNQLIRDTLLSVRERFFAAGGFILRNKSQMAEAFEGHLRLVESLKRGDFAEAGKIMHAHLLFARRALIS
jgi:DNA-binding GntR family transcriptional regulator